MNSSQVRRLRATWRKTCHFVKGDRGIADYLTMISDAVLLSPKYIQLTEAIYKFTDELVTDGIAEWADTDSSCGDVKLYKNGYDPEKWAPCCVARIVEPLYCTRTIDRTYAADLFEIYQLGREIIRALGYDYHDLATLIPEPRSQNCIYTISNMAILLDGRKTRLVKMIKRGWIHLNISNIMMLIGIRTKVSLKSARSWMLNKVVQNTQHVEKLRKCSAMIIVWH